MLNYNSPPEENQTCMIEKVRGLFLNYGIRSKIEQHYDASPEIQQAIGKNVYVQRFHINRWLFEQLLFFNGDCLSVRLMIANEGPIEAWFELISRRVVPFFVQNGLPNKISLYGE